ncbi:MAG: PIN domain-containing protein [Thaumarchaeota archaeon]|nr:PIN domain-containing protein [Nitrososphaerota archaeon]
MKLDRFALDTGAFSLHFGNDPQVREIMSMILKGNAEAHTCELNLAEHYYKTCEKSGRDVAIITTGSIRETPIQIHSIDPALTLEAGALKCKYRGKISLADAYVMAVAKIYNCRLVTTDPVLKELGIVPTTLLKVP